ncbi:unnamed protein product [Leptosia nina]|uniref:RING-type domain-containing protein n=1 Tax=Leptosia nina TaxID=320188 RepID=A0AAV1ITJ1_9NEOP
MNNINKDYATRCVKILVDGCRCVNCDHLHQQRLRYICGHSVCENCVAIDNTCVLCSPTSNQEPSADKPQSDRVQHAIELLNSFQDLFNVNVYKKDRISEKLKIEKEIFPECIQASEKYYNKRKSSVFVEKETYKPSLPGEDIFAPVKVKMKSSKSYVLQWLHQNENNSKHQKENSRKPLSDLSINSPQRVNIKSNKSLLANRKRTIHKSGLDTHCKKLKLNIAVKDKCQHNESGIELDDDICVLNDSPTEVFDKDRLCMAVLEADKHNQTITLKKSNDKQKDIPKVKGIPPSTSFFKIPFYKKGTLLETCSLCKESVEQKTFYRSSINKKDVNITIDTPNFFTTIKLSEIKPKTTLEYKTAAVQTDSEISKNKILNYEACGAKNNKEEIDVYLKDKDSLDSLNKTKPIVIEESDSDSTYCEEDIEEIEIEAEVHRPNDCIDHVLRPLERKEYENRIIPKVRGTTPASSDSSDKENFDPKKRKQPAGKKKLKHKKRYC